MNMKKNSNRRLPLLMVMLPFLVTLCLAVHPAHAGIPNSTMSFSTVQLTEFEGYYQLDKDKNLYLQILVKSDKLVLKQLWDQREFTFDQKSALHFYNDERSFPLTFSKEASGEITQLLAFERDTWIKVKNYKPVEKKEISISAKEIQVYAGKDKITDDGHEAFLQFTVAGNELVVKELWSEKTYTIVPESEFVFFAKDGYYPVQFSKDKDGNVNQALIFNKDVWLKVKSQD